MVTIYDIQQGRVPEGVTVRVQEVVVSSPLVVGEGALTVQDPMGGPFSGIYVVGGSNVPAEPASIHEIQGGMVPVGTPVIVQDVVVTTPVSEGTFFVQDPMGGQLSGIQVFVADVGQGLQIQPGSRVTVTGTYGEFHDQSQLAVSAATGVEVLGSTDVPAAEVLPSSEIGSGANAEAWEGVLVRVENISVSDATDMFGDWRVDQVLFITNTFLAEGAFPMPAVSDPYASITGVLTYSFDEYRLAPRTSGDFVPG